MGASVSSTVIENFPSKQKPPVGREFSLFRSLLDPQNREDCLAQSGGRARTKVRQRRHPRGKF